MIHSLLKDPKLRFAGEVELTHVAVTDNALHAVAHPGSRVMVACGRIIYPLWVGKIRLESQPLCEGCRDKIAQESFTEIFA